MRRFVVSSVRFPLLFLCAVTFFWQGSSTRSCASPLASVAPEAASVAPEAMVSERFAMMGTAVEIKIAASEADKEHAIETIRIVREEMQSFVDRVNSWNPDSEVSLLNARAGGQPVQISPDLMRILLYARKVSELSDGAFDITFLPLAKAWKLDPETPVLPSRERIERARLLVNYRDLALDETASTASLRRAGMQLDLGGIAKGSTVDLAVRLIRQRGHQNALVNAGGDLYALGHKPGGQPWRLGIQSPREGVGPFLMKMDMEDRALATSGDYEKMVIIEGKRYHHILDPRTGAPVDTCISVSVLAPTCEEADALATAFFVLGPKDGLALCETLPGIEALWVDPNMKIIASSGFPNRQNESIPLEGSQTP